MESNPFDPAPGEIDTEGGACTRGTLHRDGAVVAANDAMDDRQPQTGPFSNRFGGKEGFKNPFLHLRCYPRARVSNRDANVWSGL